MPKDYKDAPATRKASGPQHPMLLGVIIGLLLGIVISLAVALWLNRLANPFVEKNRSVEPLPRMGGAQPAPEAGAKAPEGNARPAPDKGAKPGDRPRFEFYQILPGEKEAAPQPGPAPSPVPAPPPAAPPKAVEAPRPGSSPASPKPHAGDVFWLQAGAFADEKEADNLRAKIALTGLEASVRSAATDKGKLYRVRLGPYQSLDDANRIKATLSQNGVAAAIIRSSDEAKNP